MAISGLAVHKKFSKLNRVTFIDLTKLKVCHNMCNPRKKVFFGDCRACKSHNGLVFLWI
ncbi:transposase [Catenovulum adriaticum]|uniref:transposase n=1 Tax=Catenovulum adriaticum TaxID=2984846 RepID=UPI003D1806B6